MAQGYVYEDDATGWRHIVAGDLPPISPSGSAGGDLTGTYPNPTVGDVSLLTAKGDILTRGSSAPAARLAVGANNTVLTADSTQTLGVKWATASGSSPLTTKGDLYGYDTGNNRIPVGTNGYALVADSAQALGVKWAPVSTTSLTTADATIGADVTMVNANTFYDGPSVSLTAGTWVVWYKLTFGVTVATVQSYDFSARLWDGTTTYDESVIPMISTLNYAGWYVAANGFAVITLGSTTTIKASGASIRGSSASKISREIPDNSATSHTASHVSALLVA